LERERFVVGNEEVSESLHPEPLEKVSYGGPVTGVT
jgi:hypothetical protein